ncbi:hypothetical protein ASF73_16295 [Xanthomonas sp. Leaf131]|nr:hypothetical protein ASF73_16295 [Xanthomonas sp. Leaf131]
MSSRDLADHAHDREHLDLCAWRQDDRRAMWTTAVELDVVDRNLKNLANRLITIPDGQHDVAIDRTHRAVNDQDVPVADAGQDHAPALGAVEKGGRRVADQHLVQIKLVVLEILGGRGEAELDPKRADRQPQRRRIAAGRPKQAGIGMGWREGQHDANSLGMTSQKWRLRPN